MNTPTQVMWRMPRNGLGMGSVALDTVVWRKRTEFIEKCLPVYQKLFGGDEWRLRRLAADAWEKRR